MFRAQKIDATVDAVITLRQNLTGMTPKWRVTWNGRTFNIKAVLAADDRRPEQGAILHCTEEIT